MKINLDFETDFPQKHTCDGQDISPHIKFTGIPENTDNIALVIDDPDAPGQIFDHWVIWNITESELPENIPQKETLNGMKQGKNDFGEIGFRGPCPPGERHAYRIKAYALESKLGLPPGISKKQLENEIEDHVIDSEIIKKEYSR
ncbi:MAG: YbhB/YbcL family Raf kinase inhibitor-like protein [Candidatus Nanohaloarchaea archaeon]